MSARLLKIQTCTFTYKKSYRGRKWFDLLRAKEWYCHPVFVCFLDLAGALPCVPPDTILFKQINENNFIV